MNSTHTGEALFQAILDDPDDDAIRRVYADWLDDEGQYERAEFIRVQLDLSQIDEDDVRRPMLERRERELLGRHEREWLGQTFKEAAAGVCFGRGLPAKLVADLPLLLRNGEELFHACPLTSLTLMGPITGLLLDRLGECPHLSRVREFAVRPDCVRVSDLPKVLKCFPSLRKLDLELNAIGTDGVRALLGAPAARGLRSLNLTAAHVNATSVEMLCRAEALANLECLILDENGLGSSATQFLVGAKHLGNLRRLSLAHNRLSPTCARDLAQSPHLRNLTSLDLSNNSLGHDGLVELTRSPYLTHLKELDLGSTQVTPPALGHLSPLLARLRRLSLHGNHLGQGGVEALKRNRVCPPLVMLDLSGNEIGDDGARSLGDWPALSALRELRLGVNGVRAFGLRPLLFSPQMGPLRTLMLDGNRLGDMGGQVLARWPGLKGLRHLDLRGTGIGDIGAGELLGALGELDFLSLLDCDLSPEMKGRFREAQDAGRIITLAIN